MNREEAQALIDSLDISIKYIGTKEMLSLDKKLTLRDHWQFTIKNDGREFTADHYTDMHLRVEGKPVAPENFHLIESVVIEGRALHMTFLQWFYSLWGPQDDMNQAYDSFMRCRKIGSGFGEALGNEIYRKIVDAVIVLNKS